MNDNARLQLAAWPVEARSGVQLHQLDIDRRVKLARKYNVYRTPALLLLDRRGEIIWRQDGVTGETSDDFPLNLPAVESEIWELLQTNNQ
ncbi:MAG: hypothetical protein U5K99_01760 [Anaerolineales bacterium]|nr:hypothetical protein [Anaerolineales bacterium]